MKLEKPQTVYLQMLQILYINRNHSTTSINSDNKKVRYKMDCYILHTALLVMMPLLIIVIICYHYTKHRSKQRCIGALTIYKWKILNSKC